MRVLHLHDRLSTRGGADHYLHDVIRLVPAEHGLVVGKWDSEPPIIPVWHLAEMESKTPENIALRPIFEAFSPDIIHVHNVMNPQVWTQLTDLPVVTTLHDHRVFCPGQGKWTLQQSPCNVPMALSQCQGCFDSESYFDRIMKTTEERQKGLAPFPVTVVSQYMAEEVRQVGLSVVSVIPPWIPEGEDSGSGTASTAIVCVGRLVESKGIWNAVKVWRQANTDLPLVFVGTGRERGALERAGFEVTGWLSRQRTLDWIRAAKAVLFLPNWQEPFGMVGPEALSLGTPVVAWRSGGIPEWCPPHTLVEFGDIEEAAQRLRNVLIDGLLTERSSGHREISFSESWVDTYQTVIEGHAESGKMS